MHGSSFNHTKRSRSPSSTTRQIWNGATSSRATQNVDDEVNGRGMANKPVDCSAVDGSEEDGDGPLEEDPVRGKTNRYKDDELYASENGMRSLTGVPTRFASSNQDGAEEFDMVGGAPTSGGCARRDEFLQHNHMTSPTSAEDKEATNGDQMEGERCNQNLPVHPSEAPKGICGDGENAQKSEEEPVVRPKTRNMAGSNCIKPKICFDHDDNPNDAIPHSTSGWKYISDDDEGHADGPSRTDRGESSSGYSRSKYSKHRKKTRSDQAKPGKVPRQRRTFTNPHFWSYNDNYYNFSDGDSDSDSEWVTSLRRKYRSQEHTNMSSDSESCESLQEKEDSEPEQARGSIDTSTNTVSRPTSTANADELGESQATPPPELQQMSSEGQVAWLQINEINETDSSSEDESHSSEEFLQPGVFMLDDNSNAEDDSSVSEDLEVDWGLFDGFADELGVAEAISYVDPQFLTYVALEERLAQAMETALAHLEFLAVDVEVANPAASKESIEALPEIPVTEDQSTIGQETCCPICCSEYIRGEVATEMPCHHYFHKSCISIWLQKSGTCPVCRCVFPPPP